MEEVNTESTKSTESLNENSSPIQSFKGQIGGARPGAGRPKGSKDPQTIEKETARRLFENRILQNIQELLSAQFNIAKGASYVYRIEQNPKTGSKEHVLVTDPYEIKKFLDELQGDNGPLEEDGDFYYITTKNPENRALDSLIDRVFGKAPQTINNKISGDLKLITGMKIVKDNGDIGNTIQDQES